MREVGGWGTGCVWVTWVGGADQIVAEQGRIKFITSHKQSGFGVSVGVVMLELIWQSSAELRKLQPCARAKPHSLATVTNCCTFLLKTLYFLEGFARGPG